MIYDIRLKTGFYETKLYNMMITYSKIELFPVGSGKLITIKETELVAVTIRSKKHPEIEIQTHSQTYNGIFNRHPDLKEVCRVLKENLKKKIIFEGGLSDG